jgi:hypothetical protein
MLIDPVAQQTPVSQPVGADVTGQEDVGDLETSSGGVGLDPERRELLAQEPAVEAGIGVDARVLDDFRQRGEDREAGAGRPGPAGWPPRTGAEVVL